MLGPTVWLNTIVALTHAAAPLPAGPGGGPLAFDVFANQRSHLLQAVIREASGDARLMNPIAFVETHPACRRNAQARGPRGRARALSAPQLLSLCRCTLRPPQALRCHAPSDQRSKFTPAASHPKKHKQTTTPQSQPILPNGTPWRQHLFLMLVSAKLLADTEAMLQMAGGSGPEGAGGADADGGGRALVEAMMRVQRAPPVAYLASQLTQFSRPLRCARARARSTRANARAPLTRCARCRRVTLRGLPSRRCPPLPRPFFRA